MFDMAFPNMLLDLNNCLPGPISDHRPMTVDLSFKDTTISASKTIDREQESGSN